MMLAVGFGWVLHSGGLPLLPPAGSLETLDSWNFGLFVIGMLVHMTTRFARYHFLIVPIARVPMRRILTINAIALALITFLPLRMGEVARPAMLQKKGHLSAWAVMGTVAAERILDGVVFSAMLIAGMSVTVPRKPIPDHIGSLPIPASLAPEVARAASGVFGIAFLGMVAFYRYRTMARALIERTLGLVSRGLAAKMADVVERTGHGLRFLTHARHAAAYLGTTAVSLGSQVLAMELLARGLGMPELTFARSMVLLGLVALGFSMPNAPGFFGTVQLALYAGLATYVAPEKVAVSGAAFVFVFYAAYLTIVVALAVLAILVEYLSPITDSPDSSGPT